MKYLKVALVSAMFGCLTSAIAGQGTVLTTVTALAPNVSYSTGGTKPLVTYIGYLVTVGSDTSNTNTINNIAFTGTASAGSALATDPDEKPTFFSADGATCTTTNADQTAISCTIGQLRAGQTYPTFAVFFKAPVKVVNGIADNPTEDFAKFSGITYYAEGAGGEPQSTPENSTKLWSAADVLLGTPSPTNVKSSVPKSGGSFFTGSGVTTSNDKFATLVTVPTATTYTAEASIDEAPFTTSLSGGMLPLTTLTCVNFTPCYQSAVTVPGEFGYLTIVLRQDASTIKAGVKIGSVLIWYDGSGALLDSYHGYLGMCPSPTTTLSDRPCIASSKHYKKMQDTGGNADLLGDFEWTIISLKNGRLTLQ